MKSHTLRYGFWFRPLRIFIKYSLNVVYPIVRLSYKFPRVQSIEETILELIEYQKSIVRYGDNEILIIQNNVDLPFQKFDTDLSENLRSILVSRNDKILIGLPDAYRSCKDFKLRTKIFWRAQVAYLYPRIFRLLDLDKIYYNANITRLYYGYRNKSKSAYYFSLIRKLWEDRQILLIEGEKSRLGMGNDFFANAQSIERILGPAHHAYDQIDNLFAEAIKHQKSKLVLVAMGPTAKVLVYRLAMEGFQTIDIGNLDLEYEWFKKGVKERILIPGKYVSEVKGGRVVGAVTDKEYLSQIVAKCL